MIDEDLDELVGLPPKKSHKECTVTFALKQFDAPRRAKLMEAIDRADADSLKIAQFFLKQNIDVPVSLIRRHRLRLRANGTGCKCPVTI